MKNTFITTILIAITLCVVSCTAQKKIVVVSKWEILGTRIVSKKIDHDELWVTAAKGTYKKLKLKVVQAPVYVKNVRVLYANGSSENHSIQRRFAKGTSSKVLDLKGGNRIIKKITFNYKTLTPRHGKAKIIVFAKK